MKTISIKAQNKQTEKSFHLNRKIYYYQQKLRNMMMMNIIEFMNMTFDTEVESVSILRLISNV